MRWLLALALLTMSLAGCTQPASPGPTPGAAPPSDAQAGQQLIGVDAVSGSPPPQTPPTPADPATRTEPEPAAPSPGANLSAAPEDRPAPPAEPAAAPPPPPSPPKPRSDAVSRLHVGDTWRFVGKNLSGGSTSSEESVTGTGWVQGMPTYIVASRTGRTTTVANVTREGLNPINESGFVLELLRFPLTAGANWTFGWSQGVAYQGGNTTPGGVLHESLRGAVEVLGVGNRSTIAGRFEAWHVQANLTHVVGASSSWMLLDYWFAPGARNIVRMDSRTDQGRAAWSELLGMDLED